MKIIYFFYQPRNQFKKMFRNIIMIIFKLFFYFLKFIFNTAHQNNLKIYIKNNFK
jgi:hypothetical protein